MALRRTLTLFTLLFLSVLAQYNDYPPTPDPQVCGKIIDANLNDDYVWFLASDIKDCLVTVPFDPAVGTRFVRYYDQILQFQSTSAFLKTPPAGYQQPAFDIFASLQTIQHRIDTGYYHNQYAFEVELQQISHYSHDAHMILYAGILAQFYFSIPYYLITASEDGKALPKVYKYNATSNAVYGPAIRTIDGTPAVQWLSEYAAAQSFGMLEPNAEWNEIMVSPAQLITGATNSLSGGGTFYTRDYSDVVYEDGSTESWHWIAYYLSPGWTGPLATGGDFYNFFVLGLPPANYEATYNDWINSHPSNETDSNSTDIPIDLSIQDDCPSESSWHNVNSAYPADTVMHEACLGLYSTGTLSGYLHEDISTAVLSIPTFDSYAEGTFEQAIVDFQNNVTTAEKLIVDLQSCTGGDVRLAFYTFNQLLPNNSPYAGSQLRDHALANEFSSALTAEFVNLNPNSDEYLELTGNEWVVTNRIDAQTGRNFTSWQDFYGPIAQSGDDFSKVEQYDLNDPYSFLGFSYPECHQSRTCPRQWTAENIVILTDGVCSSTCALFLEMMTEAGVRTVVVGGIPQVGPMQAASGSRGAVSYTSDDVDEDANLSQAVGYLNDTGMLVEYMGITLRHQLKPQNDVPTQFIYQPATCRIFWTLSSAVNYTHLWYDTYNAIWNDTSICVLGSVNAQPPSTQNNQSTTLKVSLGGFMNQGMTSATKYTPMDAGDMPHFRYCDRKSETGNTFIKSSDMCQGRGICQAFDIPCESPMVKRYVCVETCTLHNGQSDTCPNYCKLDVNGGVNGAEVAYDPSADVNMYVQTGSCKLKIKNKSKACNVYHGDGNVPL